MRKVYSHGIAVDRPVDEAFPLFTPKGEEAWVPGWQPTYLRPQTGETCEEMIFLTGEGAETTYWTCLAWQPEQWHVRYFRLTPGSRVAFVDVQCRPDGADRTHVNVVYDTLALSDDGRAWLDALDEAAFARTIDAWSDQIRALA